MAVEIIDGKAGEPHIDGADKGRLHAGIVGAESVVLETGSRLKATKESENRVTVGTGDCLIHGRHASVTSPESVTIQSGTQGQRRNDLICLHYHRDSTAEAIESGELVVLKGTPSADAPADPSVPRGSVLDGAADDYFPLYRVSLNGVTASEPVPLFKTVPPLSAVWDSVSRSGRLFAGDLGRLPVDGAGHIRLWTNDEFKAEFGADPQNCLIAVNNRASGSSGIFLSSPRWNGDAVFVTQMAAADGAVKPIPGDGATASTPVAYLVAVY